MKADITRDTFDRSRHFSRVLAQQGRPQVDADFNEQAAILLHRQHALAADLIGLHGAPPKVGATDPDGFKIEMPGGAADFTIGKGHYYVDGILCENEGLKDANGIFQDVHYLEQPDYHPPTRDLPLLPALAYLDVWERHLTYQEVEDADGRVVSIRESALNGPDTATRAKVVWQVKVKSGIAACPDEGQWKSWVEAWQPKNRGLLKATAVQSTLPDLDSSCVTPPESRYRGTENQLYRVEVHKSGNAGTATFKWSRDNGSILFPVTDFVRETIRLATLGRDQHSSLEPGQWVELVDDDTAVMDWRESDLNPLGKITGIDRDEMTITVEWPAAAKFPAYRAEEYQSKHVLLRRWDQQKLPTSNVGAPRFDDLTGTCFVEESPNATSNKWLTLENGIQVCFTPPIEGEAHYYRNGDYWLIPARVVTGDVEWPGPKDYPETLRPRGVEHHYAPLALIHDPGTGLTADDCRKKISRGIDPESDLTVKNMQVNGDLTVAGRVNGRDVARDAAIFDKRIEGLNEEVKKLEQQGTIFDGGTINGDLSISGKLSAGGSGNSVAAFFQPAVNTDKSAALIAGYGSGGESFFGTQAAIMAVSRSSEAMGIYTYSPDPSYALYVAGTAYFQGSAKFAGAKDAYVVDVFINSSGQVLRTGDVVKLKGTPVVRFAGENNNIPIPEVAIADIPDDPRVIGVVAREAIPSANEPDARSNPDDQTTIPDGGELFVVTLGTFAHCKVDASEAPIEVGDLLTTSNNPGYAKKATDPRIGTIIGKALEPLAAGTGYISVFVNIQ